MNHKERILGWDLLRGMCAFAVASYHLLMWQDVIAIHTLGSYGVYLFFILSGASLSYTYFETVRAGTFSFGRFLWVRYLRLAPLYIGLMLLALPWKLVKDTVTSELLVNYLLNATMLFGFYNPATHAVLVGGWSLGIEAIFYMIFPVLMLVVSFARQWLAWGVFLLLLAVQLVWIHWALGGQATELTRQELYHQAPAFAAYFMGGCLLGAARRTGDLNTSRFSSVAVPLLLTGFVFMVAVNPDRPGLELVGSLGLVLLALCFLMVSVASWIELKARAARFAQYLGDSTYGVYLLHPVIFFGLTLVVFPKMGVVDPKLWPVTSRVLLAVAVMACAFGLALLSERYFEKPIRQRSKRAGRLVTTAS